jgi:hypothetical protein
MLRTILIYCLLAFGTAQAIDYTPLQTYVDGLGDEFKLGAVGDSWTCNAQYAGEVCGSWTDDEVGASGPYAYSLIWGDGTAMNGATWINRLGYRLGTHKVFAEAIGGAELGVLGVPFTFKEDSTIAGWIDNLADLKPKVAFLYGGINDLLGYGASPATRTYANLREQALQSTIMMLQAMPGTPIIRPTLQPCGLDYFKFKVASNPSAYANMTWTQIADTSYNAQLLVNQTNTFIMDSLRYFIEEAGYDSSLVYPYDHFEMLAQQVTWTAGAEAATYPLDLSAVTSEGAMSQADSVKYAAIRFLRPEIESDSIHANLMGLRQIGDSMAVNLFGIDLSTWEEPTPSVLYASKQTGHNWENRVHGFLSRGKPAATLQGAIVNAWPGDTIKVFGNGNQALIDQDGYSVQEYDVLIDKPVAYVEIEDGAFYFGGYEVATGNGTSIFDPDGFSGGDGKEILPTHLPLTVSSVPRVDMGGLVIKGLNVQGYHYPINAINVSEITFEDMTLVGGGQSLGGFSWVNYDDTLEVNLTNCVFYIDSSSTGAWSATYPRGRLNFQAIKDNASTLYSGTISGCQFIGDDTESNYPMITGFLDGMTYVGNLFYDTSSYVYIMENKRKNAYPDSSYAKTKFINNTWRCLYDDGSYLYCYRASGNTTNANADSVLFVNNYIDPLGGTGAIFLYGGPANEKTWFARNVIAEDATAAMRDGTGNRSLATMVSNGWASDAGGEDNWVGVVSADSDSIMFGGLTTLTHGSTYNVADYGIEHGANHASIGYVQYHSDSDIHKIGTAGEFVTTPMALMPYLRLAGALGVEATMYCSRPEVDALNLDIWLNGTHPNGSGTWEAQAQDTLKVVRVR